MSVEVRDATPDDLRAMLGYAPRGLRLAMMAFDGREPIGLVGIIREPSYVGSILEDEGRWIGFFELKKNISDIGLRAIRGIAYRLRELREEIWVQCDDTHPTAERFCTILGFRPTDQFCASWRDPSRKLRMWKWQP